MYIYLGAAPPQKNIEKDNQYVKLILHTPNNEGRLAGIYKNAMKRAVELYIFTAFLTEWDTSLELNKNCRRFKIVVGKDFGITRKAACKALLNWLPPSRKGQFMVADGLKGFHPKAIFWKDSDGRTFAVIGSSNLTKAAFETNYEANAYSEITAEEYSIAKKMDKHHREAIRWCIRRLDRKI